MFDLTEVQIVCYTLLIFIALNFLILILHFLYKSLSDSKFREAIRNIIFELDKFADEMENEEKKNKAIQDINAILGWRKVFIPSALIGIIIDLQVKAIRKMQNSTDTPNLHE